jgi:hypothetical protein
MSSLRWAAVVVSMAMPSISRFARMANPPTQCGGVNVNSIILAIGAFSVISSYYPRPYYIEWGIGLKGIDNLSREYL